MEKIIIVLLILAFLISSGCKTIETNEQLGGNNNEKN